MDEARTRVLTMAESANSRLSLLTYHSDQLKRFQHPNVSCASASDTDFEISSDWVYGGDDMDILVGDDLLLPSVAPLFTANEAVSGLLDTYHTLRDIEWAAMYLDNALQVAQQSVVDLLVPYVASSTLYGPCGYANVRVGKDAIQQEIGVGIIAANHFVLAASTAHPIGTNIFSFSCDI
jgi:hypothetical protein